VPETQSKAGAVSTTTHPLDNPIWSALTTAQAHFAEISRLARRFPPEVTSLGAFEAPTPEAYRAFAGLLPAGGTTGLFLHALPAPQAGLEVVFSIPLLQMVHIGGKLTSDAPPCELLELSATDVPEMIGLAELTRPGPFGTRTRELGTYLGIRQAGRLVAMAGERLRFPGFTEVSAVCTHPDYLGRGYARALMSAIMERILDRGEVPILHTRADNTRANAIYERLGFRTRLQLHYVVFRKAAG
jgi:ribosomal protein S18 acetylase RimI-like enzyme